MGLEKVEQSQDRRQQLELEIKELAEKIEALDADMRALMTAKPAGLTEIEVQENLANRSEMLRKMERDREKLLQERLKKQQAVRRLTEVAE